MKSVRRLTNRDLSRVFSYIKNEPEANLFIQGDLELYGLESPNVTLYAFQDPWDCILLKYYSNFVLYSTNLTFNAKLVASFLEKQEKIEVLSAKESLLERMKPFYPHVKTQGTYLCRCNKTSFNPIEGKTLPIKQLCKDDARDIVTLYQHIEEFAKPYLEHTEEKLVQTANNYEKGGVGFGLYMDDKLICTAYNTATTTTGAMIVGVATHPDYRKQGYASQVVTRLCSFSFESGLDFLCLFYDNPQAGTIYKRIGFETIGRWSMLKF